MSDRRARAAGGTMKVALVGINSPGYRSLALAYLRAFAQADERLSEVAFATLDLDTAQDPWWVAYRILQLDPDVVGLSVVCWNARTVYEAARIVKTAKPEVLVVLGGPEVGPIAEDVLAHQAAVDAVVRGEGEATFAEFLDAVANSQSAWLVPGLTARVDGEVVSTPDRPLIADLDSIPSPYLSGVLAPVDGATYLETYRGCPHRCAYCFEGKGYGAIRRFSEERVLAEIDFVAGAPGVRSFSFIDPVFNLTDERLERLSSALAPYAQRGTRLHTVEVDIVRIDERQAGLLERAGVASVETGPQTVGAAALAACHRGLDRERFSRGVDALRGLGIGVECDLIVGLPGDTLESVVEGLDFAVGLDPGRVQVSTLHVLPGTEFWNRADELGLRYDPEPPHEVVATAQMSFGDLRRAEMLAVAAAQAYRATL